MLCWETVSIGSGAARNTIRSGCIGEGWFQVLWASSVMLLSGPRASRWPNVGSGLGSQCHSEFGFLTDRGEVGDGDMVFRKATVFNFLTMALMWDPRLGNSTSDFCSSLATAGRFASSTTARTRGVKRPFPVRLVQPHLCGKFAHASWREPEVKGQKVGTVVLHILNFDGHCGL